MTARVLDGRALAKEIYAEVAAAVALRVSRGGPRPRLATVLVGDDPASAQYVTLKQRNAKMVGIESEDHRLPAHTTTDDLLSLVESLNGNDDVSAILIQQPAPRQIDMTRVVLALDPVKDVDGFHPLNAGRVFLGMPGGVEPCTPAGIIELLQRAGIRIEGADACVVGRSNLVGKPMAVLLLRRNATVTVCHTRTRNLADHTRSADILVAAAGRPNLITKEMVKAGAAVVEVRTNWSEGQEIGGRGAGVAGGGAQRQGLGRGMPGLEPSRRGPQRRVHAEAASGLLHRAD